MEGTIEGIDLSIWSAFTEIHCDSSLNSKTLPEETKTPERPKKRLRQSPATALYTPLPACVSCKGTNVIEDVEQGQIVCTDCGLIQSQGVFTVDSAHCSWDRIKMGSRVYIHRYSKVTHFVSVIRSLQGQTNPDGCAEVVRSLQARLGGREPTVERVSVILKDIGLRGKYNRHVSSICVKLGGAPVMSVVTDGMLLSMCKKFRRYEYWYGICKKYIWSTDRKVFFSYPFLVYKMLEGMNIQAPESLLLKCKVRRQEQFDAFDRLEQYIAREACATK